MAVALKASMATTRCGGGAISELQELVQSDKRFPVPACRPILQWAFDTRMANAVTLEFRATVSFVLEGIPHHCSGEWQSSKKSAKKDTAQRMLRLLNSQKPMGDAVSCTGALATSLVQKLQTYCSMLTKGYDANPLKWRILCSAEGWQALVDIDLFGGVAHTLLGAICPDEDSAREDTAHRALWYLQCPGYERAFAVTNEAAAEDTLDVPGPDKWRRDGSCSAAGEATSELQRIAEEKTVLMRLQNRLQRAYAKYLPKGASVWEWSYDFSSGSMFEAPLSRAKVRIAGVGLEFLGEWSRGQKNAQLDVCARVIEYLDAEEARDEKPSRS